MVDVRSLLQATTQYSPEMSASAAYDTFFRQLTDLSSGNSTSPAERVALVHKYDIGRDEEAEIPAWEDPDLSLYKCTDRYGFMQ